MALVLADRVRETTNTTGTGTVTLLGASTGYQSFAVVGNANTTYYCIAGQGTAQWEVGIGTYTLSGTTLARTSVLASSNAGSLVNFNAGTKDVFVTYPATYSVVSASASKNSEFLSGTVLLFYQASAPTGWTQVTTQNDKVLRVVSSTGGGSGGTTAFTSVFTNQTPTITTSGLSAAAFTLDTTRIPAHTHTYIRPQPGSLVPNINGTGAGAANTETSPTGGGGSHAHTISGSATSSAVTLDVQYIDILLASKS
jgi:hypothetical protein